MLDCIEAATIHTLRLKYLFSQNIKILPARKCISVKKVGPLPRGKKATSFPKDFFQNIFCFGKN